jgi:type I restriction enzyme S subunit
MAQSLNVEAEEVAHNVLPSLVSSMCQDGTRWGRVREVVERRKGAVRSGPFGSQLLHEEFVEDGVAAIGTRDVRVNRLDLVSGWFVTPEKFKTLTRYQVFPGDVLCTIVGASIGRFCVVPNGVPAAFTTKHVQAITLDREVAFSPFVTWMLNYHSRCRRSLFSQVEGSAQPSLNAEKVLSTELPIPPIALQHQMVERLESAEQRLSAIREAQGLVADDLEALFPSILDRAFKGEL